jgi:hypothetical protein
MTDEHKFIKDKLLKHFPATCKGVWEIYGEDPNCDVGGSHHTPLLQVVEGTYINVVEYALTLPGFFTWGGGGNIKLQEITRPAINVDEINSECRKELNNKKDQLQKEIDEINIKLGLNPIKAR